VSDGAVGRFARWSQRKHAARQAGRGSAAPAAIADDKAELKDFGDAMAPDAGALRQPADEQGSTPPVGQAAAAAPAEGDQAREDIVASLTPLEDLTAESDYTQFLADGVPQALRNAALRKLWTSDPVFAVLDGLNDYDEDFNLTDRIITVADTNYKVGRGFLDDEEKPEDREPEPGTPDVPQPAEVAEDGPEDPGGAAEQTPEIAASESESETPAVEPAVELAVDESREDGDGDPNSALGKKSHAPDDGTPAPA